MGWKQRLGEKLKSAGRGAWRIGKKVAKGTLIAGAAILGAKAVWDAGGGDYIKGKVKEEVQQSIVDPAKEELTAQGEAAALNIQDIAEQAQSGAVSAVHAAVNPFSSQSAGEAFQAGGGEQMQHQVELIQHLGNKPAAQAVQDRYDQAHALPMENAPTGTMAERGVDVSSGSGGGEGQGLVMEGGVPQTFGPELPPKEPGFFRRQAGKLDRRGKPYKEKKKKKTKK